MTRTFRGGRALAAALALALVALATGCFQQDNNADFLRSAPPGVNPFPNENVAQRKSRTARELQDILAAKKASAKSAKKGSRKPR